MAEYLHDEQVFALAMHPDGCRLGTGTGQGTVTLWNLDADTRPLSWPGHQDEVWTTAFSPDGKMLLTGSRGRTVVGGNATTGEPLWLGSISNHANAAATIVFQNQPVAPVACSSYFSTVPLRLVLEQRVRGMAFTPDGQTILTASGDTTKGSARLWDARTGKRRDSPLETGSVVWAAALNPSQKTCATANDEGVVRLWDLANRRWSPLVMGDHSRMVVLAFSPDGKSLLAGSTDRTVRRWRTDTGEPLGDSLLHTSATWAVGISPDSQILIAGGRDGSLRYWDAATVLALGSIRAHRGAIWELACSPGDRSVFTASADHTVLNRRCRRPCPVRPSI